MYDDNRPYSAQEHQRVWKHSSEIAQEVEENTLGEGDSDGDGGSDDDNDDGNKSMSSRQIRYNDNNINGTRSRSV